MQNITDRHEIFLRKDSDTPLHNQHGLGSPHEHSVASLSHTPHGPDHKSNHGTLNLHHFESNPEVLQIVTCTSSWAFSKDNSTKVKWPWLEFSAMAIATSQWSIIHQTPNICVKSRTTHRGNGDTTLLLFWCLVNFIKCYCLSPSILWQNLSKQTPLELQISFCNASTEISKIQ